MEMLLVIAAALAAGWLWNDTLKARERVLLRCRRACDEINVQLLDETVALKRLGLKRKPGGQVALRRTYQFEFSVDGSDRWSGRAVLLGRTLESLQLDGPGGVTIFNAGGVVPFRQTLPPGERLH